jgi:hypothetical protein
MLKQWKLNYNNYYQAIITKFYKEHLTDYVIINNTSMYNNFTKNPPMEVIQKRVILSSYRPL